VPSPRAALVYKPAEMQSYYVSYGTSFNPSAENLSLSSKNANLAPEKDRTYEAGAKIGWFGGQLSTTLAVFNTEMTNARVSDPDDPLLQELSGKQRVNGIELGASGYVTERLEILAGVTYLDPKTVSSTAPAQIGKVLQNTARSAADVWVEYTLSDQWQIGGGLNYVGLRYADPTGLDIIPSYVVWNAMAAYHLTDDIGIQLNLDNVTDTAYFDNSYYSSPVENHIVPGAGRTLTATATFEF
jgi:catecholate siderophore receptor